jgi:septum site-determining protein MinC
VDEAITIKGIRDGLLVRLGDGDWDMLTAALLARIDARPDFFRGASVAVHVGARMLEDDAIKKLNDSLAEREVRLWALLGESPETARAARRLQLETELPDPLPPVEELPPIDSDERGSQGVLVRHTLRSGRSVRHSGHVVIIGDVNPGAEVVAGGDVVVWGRLRGTVHAGAGGDETAVICALNLSPMQLRIASHIAVSAPESKRKPRPETASVRDGQIVAEEWVP